MTNQNNNDNVKMGKWRALGALDIIIGVLTIILNTATLIVMLYDWVDWMAVGIWGGSFFISAGSLTIKRNPRMASLSITSITTALILIALYAYNIIIHDQTYFCSTFFSKYNNETGHFTFYIDQEKCDWRLAADITFIVLGCLAFIVNVILSSNAKRIIKLRVTVRHIMVATNYPMTTYQQTVYQVPVNNYPQQQPGVAYQPGYPTGQPGYPTAQYGYPTGKPGYPTGPPSYSSAQQEQPEQQINNPAANTTQF